MNSSCTTFIIRPHSILLNYCSAMRCMFLLFLQKVYLTNKMFYSTDQCCQLLPILNFTETLFLIAFICAPIAVSMCLALHPILSIKTTRFSSGAPVPGNKICPSLLRTQESNTLRMMLSSSCLAWFCVKTQLFCARHKTSLISSPR